MQFDLKGICTARARSRMILHLTIYSAALCVILIYQSVSIEDQLVIVTAEVLQHRVKPCNVTAPTNESSSRLRGLESVVATLKGLDLSLEASYNESQRRTNNINESQGTSFKK